MAAKILLFFTAAAFLTGVLSCATVHKVVKVEESLNGKEVEVSRGGTVVIRLESNPTTGFKWELAKISDENIVQLLDHKFIPPRKKAKKGKGWMTGVPGKEVWKFKALKKGVCRVHLDYSRPWEGGEKGVKKYVLTIKVK
ncbi:MAG: protease inhibitor I42 family protein [Candidatus Aminicenantales bacterium]